MEALKHIVLNVNAPNHEVVFEVHEGDIEYFQACEGSNSYFGVMRVAMALNTFLIVGGPTISATM